MPLRAIEDPGEDAFQTPAFLTPAFQTPAGPSQGGIAPPDPGEDSSCSDSMPHLEWVRCGMPPVVRRSTRVRLQNAPLRQSGPGLPYQDPQEQEQMSVEEQVRGSMHAHLLFTWTRVQSTTMPDRWYWRNSGSGATQWLVAGMRAWSGPADGTAREVLDEDAAS
jgi:hypothetical protein